MVGLALACCCCVYDFLLFACCLCCWLSRVGLEQLPLVELCARVCVCMCVRIRP